jgi:hypothetical protein
VKEIIKLLEFLSHANPPVTPETLPLATNVPFQKSGGQRSSCARRCNAIPTAAATASAAAPSR